MGDFERLMPTIKKDLIKCGRGNGKIKLYYDYIHKFLLKTFPIQCDIYDSIDVVMSELDDLKNFSENNLLSYMEKFKHPKCNYAHNYNKRNKYILDYYKYKDTEKKVFDLAKECFNEVHNKDMNDKVLELNLDDLKYYLYKTCANCYKDVPILESIEVTFNMAGLYKMKKIFCCDNCCDEFAKRISKMQIL